MNDYDLEPYGDVAYSDADLDADNDAEDAERRTSHRPTLDALLTLEAAILNVMTYDLHASERRALAESLEITRSWLLSTKGSIYHANRITPR